jgi:2-dehydro-3-deoxyphosphooctonate aldolase (KDO 8-P synthase)
MFKIIAGPCVIESREHAIFMATELSNICNEFDFEFIFKASLEKANRTSHNSYMGPGFENGPCIMREIKNKLGCKITTDVHEAWQVEKLEGFDYLQIPAFLCRQTSLIKACAESHIPTNIKKGQFLAPQDTKHIVEKFKHFGGKKIHLVERGTTFGYGNLVVDFTGIPIMRQYAPVIFDATHSVQKPNSGDGKTGGNREMISYLIKAACVVGVDGIFMEVHDNPDEALSDGPNSLHLQDFKETLEFIKKLLNCV